MSIDMCSVARVNPMPKVVSKHIAQGNGQNVPKSMTSKNTVDGDKKKA